MSQSLEQTRLDSREFKTEQDALDFFLLVVARSLWAEPNINADTDPHIGTYYREPSTESRPPLGDSRLAYADSFFFYDGDFNEAYYVPTGEMERVASYIIEKMKQDPDWMTAVLDVIHRGSRELAELFNSFGLEPDFSSMGDEELLDIYALHHQVHTELYDTARIPEALDRGGGLYSATLQDFIRQRLEVLEMNSSDETVQTLFLDLTSQENFTVLEMFNMEMLQLAVKIEQDREPVAGKSLKKHFLEAAESGSMKYVWLHLRPKYRQEVAEILEKYRYLPYHGFANRRLMDEQELLLKISKLLKNNPNDVLQEKYEQLDQNRARKQEAVEHLGIEEPWLSMFEVYPRIGVEKMYRRLAQLKNFYYLDLMLTEISSRFDLTEAEIRFCTPQEIINLLSTDGVNLARLLQRIRHRQIEQAAFASSGTYAYRFDESDNVAEIIATIEENKDVEEEEEGMLKGQGISGGVQKGTVIHATRPEDLYKVPLLSGSVVIIVSGSTDPDLMMSLAEFEKEKKVQVGGIVTQTGGATCHAGITAREKRIPAVVGVNNCLKRLNPGDRVRIDGTKGIIEVLTEAEDVANTAPLPSVVDIKDAKPETIGGKAFNIYRLSEQAASLDYRVPKAIFLEYRQIEAEVRKAWMALDLEGGHKSYQLSEKLVDLVKESILALGFDEQTQFAIRSSAFAEDAGDSALAGAFHSELFIDPDRLLHQLKMYIIDLAEKPDEYEGGLIIQEMVEPDFSGVMFTQDVTTSDGNNMLVEGMMGDNTGITGGTASPARLQLDRQAGISGTIAQYNPGNGDSEVEEALRRKLANAQFSTLLTTVGLGVEQAFPECKKKGADIEWAVKDGELYLLQCRPITARA